MTTTIEAYHRPKEIKEAVKLKSTNPGAVWLAGGTQVNRAPLDRGRPEIVIDLRDVVPAGVLREGTDTVIGGITTLQDLADSDSAPEALRKAAGFIPTRSIRNQATVAGNIGAGRPDSYLIPALIALAAMARTTEGTVTVEEYVAGRMDELILDIHVPAPVGTCVVVKESRSHIALPVVSAAVSLTSDDEHGISGACVAVGCVSDRTIRLTAIEEAIVADKLSAVEDLEAAIRQAVEPKADILGSAEYKKYVNGVVIAGAIQRCREALR